MANIKGANKDAECVNSKLWGFITIISSIKINMGRGMLSKLIAQRKEIVTLNCTFATKQTVMTSCLESH